VGGQRNGVHVSEEYYIEIAASLTMPSQVPAGVSAVQGLGSYKKSKETLTSLSLSYPERPVFVRSSPQLEKCPSVEPPSFVPKMVEIDSVLETGRRNCLLGSACSGQAAMTWCAVWRGSPLAVVVWVKQSEAETGGVTYSPLKAWPVRSLIHVLIVGTLRLRS
jgi:hypothetical protein